MSRATDGNWNPVAWVRAAGTFLLVLTLTAGQAAGQTAGVGMPPTQTAVFEIPPREDPPAAGGGAFVNFEEPQTQPITVATVGAGAEARRYLAVVNTPDNSLEIYDANWPWDFVTRVRTGLGPVTVRWNSSLSQLFVCNFSGDSVTVVGLKMGDGPEPLIAVLERTVHVGDEPSDIAFSSDGSTAFVTLSNKASVSIRDSSDLSAITERDLLELDVGPGLPHAVKAPRQIWIDDNDRMMVLNFMGEISDPASGGQDYDLDIYVDDPTGGQSQVRGLGSTHHAFALSPDGTKMFVVGTRAQHLDPVGVAEVSQLETGFVQSWLFVLDVPATGAPTPVPEATAGGSTWTTFQSLNLNRDYSVAALTGLKPPDTLAQPTGVVVVPNQLGEIDKLYVTAFHSDKIARLAPDAGAPGGWDVQRIEVPLLNTAPDDGYSIAGPRGLAFGARLGAEGGGVDNFLFVANRLDNTVFVLSATTEAQAGHFALQNDPTPVVVRKGREHLYDAEEHSFNPVELTGSGAVSCASCHVDGRTDGLPWNLGGPGAGPAIPDGFHDLDGQTLDTMPEFPEDKGIMITQTLLGLVNYPTNEAGQFAFTNAPYHWRGDKGAFDDFNEAFVNLQGMENLGDDPADPAGLTFQQMREYRLFINTLRHPPNPDQDLERQQTGDIGEDPNVIADASGTNLGMVLFHVNHVLGPVNFRACVSCHSLPDGSSNTATLTGGVPRTTTSGEPDPQQHPFETAAMRNLRQRESRFLALTPAGLENAVTANFGLLHSGISPSQELFVLNVFSGTMPGPTQEEMNEQILALIEFVQQFDSGIAPAASRAHTLGQSDDTDMLILLEGQALEGNVGLAAFVRHDGDETGYWFDVTASPPAYREEGTGTFIDRATLVSRASGAGNVGILQGTPLGTDRRWASDGGVAAQMSGPRPADIVLEPMAPSTPWADVAGLNQFTWQQSPGAPAENSNMWSRQAFQLALIPHAQFGVPEERHEPPRRFRVSGDNIKPGARLYIGMPKEDPQSLPVQVLAMELYPTRYTDAGGRQIWETSQEAAPLITLAMLAGGPWAPGVVPTYVRTTNAPDLQPVAWNGYLAVVQNEEGDLSDNLDDWQVLSVQDDR